MCPPSHRTMCEFSAPCLVSILMLICVYSPQHYRWSQAWSWCFQKASLEPAEKTACTGRNQSSLTAAGGLKQGQLALINEKCKSQVWDREAQSCKGKMQEEKKGEQPPNWTQPKPKSKVQYNLHIKDPTPKPPTGMQKLTHNLPKSFVCEESAIIIIIMKIY